MDAFADTLPALVDAATRALAHPARAQLLLDGPGPVAGRAHGVELLDRHGTPLLLCDPHSPLATAAPGTRGATLTVQGAGGGQRVLFRGRLAPVGRSHLGGREVVRVELRLTGVQVGTDGGPTVPVPLEDYHRRRDPALTAYAEALREHTDSAHRGELRELAARLGGALDRNDDLNPDGVVAAAQLVRLDCTGTVLRWIDVDGVHEVRLVFPRPALTRHELGEHLRHVLRPHG